jgi:surfactin synthase thioesterase subunit
MFVPWRRLLPADVALTIVRLPGRESRMTEPPLTDVDAVTDELAMAVSHGSRLPWSLFGYSLGALLAYELAVRLSQPGHRAPDLLLVGGAEPPHLSRIGPSLSELDPVEFVGALRAFGGTPSEVFEHSELLDLVLPALRADFQLLDSYRPRAHPPLSCPIVTYSGTSDSELDDTRVRRWSELTTAPTSHRLFEGGHFFLTDKVIEVVAAVRQDIDSAKPAG